MEACVVALDMLAVLLFAFFGQRVLRMGPIESTLRLVGSVWLLWWQAVNTQQSRRLLAVIGEDC